MDISKTLGSRTTLEYLAQLHQKPFVQIGRELNITPQQLADWIKKRRPIPQERLESLSGYFEVDKEMLVDESRFARDLCDLTRIDLQMIVFNRRMEECSEPELAEAYRQTLERLKKERQVQVRIGRLAALLHSGDEIVEKEIDTLLDKLEKNV